MKFLKKSDIYCIKIFLFYLGFHLCHLLVVSQQRHQPRHLWRHEQQLPI